MGALQQQTLHVLKQFVEPGSEVAVLDFPRHQNAGDALIWLGTMRYLARLGVRVRYVATTLHFQPEELRRRVPSGPILIQGGGNLGDRYPLHHRFRELIVETFADRRIVQLPQSVEFAREETLTQAQKVFGAHQDLVLLARDHAAEARCREYFPGAQTVFCPDMALGLGEDLQPRVAQHDVVLLARTDSESTRPRFDFPEWVDLERRDWQLRGPWNVAYRGCRLPEDVARVVPIVAPAVVDAIAAGYAGIAELNRASAYRIVRRGQVLVTDRLHAAVLGRLVGVPTVAIDNSNGKIGDIHRAYLGALGGVRLARNTEQAVAAALELLDGATA
ncbi:MAG: polysaccharide pyruvyl transferase family protein [Sporichthyaceae bacterium]